MRGIEIKMEKYEFDYVQKLLFFILLFIPHDLEQPDTRHNVK